MKYANLKSAVCHTKVIVQKGDHGEMQLSKRNLSWTLGQILITQMLKVIL